MFTNEFSASNLVLKYNVKIQLKRQKEFSRIEVVNCEARN